MASCIICNMYCLFFRAFISRINTLYPTWLFWCLCWLHAWCEPAKYVSTNAYLSLKWNCKYDVLKVFDFNKQSISVTQEGEAFSLYYNQSQIKNLMGVSGMILIKTSSLYFHRYSTINLCCFWPTCYLSVQNTSRWDLALIKRSEADQRVLHASGIKLSGLFLFFTLANT